MTNLIRRKLDINDRVAFSDEDANGRRRAARRSPRDVAGHCDGAEGWDAGATGLGNAIVPQVAEFIFERIKEAEEACQSSHERTA